MSRALLAGSVALLLGILAIAVQATRADPGPGGRAAQLVPASALAFARLDTDPGDPAARRLARLAPQVPFFDRARDSALEAISPAPGAFDLRRDVRPWLGDEAAVALVDLGGGRFGSLVLASVRDEPRAEALLQRVAGARPAVRTGKAGGRRFGTDGAAAFVRGFLVAGPEPAVGRAIDTAHGDAPSLAKSGTFTRALAGARRPAEIYVSSRGVGATLAADGRGLRIRARAVGTRRAGADAVALVGRVPA